MVEAVSEQSARKPRPLIGVRTGDRAYRYGPSIAHPPRRVALLHACS